MAKPNYAFEKRQRDLAKKKKKEEKKLRKAAISDDQVQDGETPEVQPGSPDDDKTDA